MEPSDPPDGVADGFEAKVVNTARDRLAHRGYPELARAPASYRQGTLMLRGRLTSQYRRQVALELVCRIEGVDRVVNPIEVGMTADRVRHPSIMVGGTTMPQMTSVVRRQVEISDPCGLRMRTAAQFIGLAGRFRSDVWIIHDGRRYNGKSMRDLMTMVAECGTRLELEAHGPDAQAAVAALAQAVAPSPA